MLVRNKFNGHQPDGRRVYPVGGGVGEAMLLGAAMGGGSAAITGGDPLKGALLGGITGGIGGGISSALPGAEAGTLAGSTLGANPTAAQVGTQLGVQGAATGAGSQAAMLADQMAGFGSQGLTSLQGAAQGAIPTSALAPSAVTPVGTAVQQSVIPASPGGTFTEGMARFVQDPLRSLSQHKFLAGASALAGATGARPDMDMPSSKYSGPLSKFRFDPRKYNRSTYAGGGIIALAAGGSPARRPDGGISSLGAYSDGGRMLRGPGDGMSDSIPGVIGDNRPARLADGEFVVPADVVSGLGNGSTDAGARQLYAMMNRVRRARTGRKSQGRQINPEDYMPKGSRNMKRFAEGGTTSSYDDLVKEAYGMLGRSGVGDSPSQIDPEGYNYWTGQLESGAISPQEFKSIFDTSASTVLANPQPESQAVADYVTDYLVRNAYEDLGRTDIGPARSQIDPEGYNYWAGQLSSGALSPSEFGSAFNTSASSVISNPVEQSQSVADYVADYLVRDAYGNIGRTGIGSNPNQIDPEGYEYWLGQLKSGALSPDTFRTAFSNSVSSVLANPTDQNRAVADYVAKYQNLPVSPPVNAPVSPPVNAPVSPPVNLPNLPPSVADYQPIRYSPKYDQYGQGIASLFGRGYSQYFQPPQSTPVYAYAPPRDYLVYPPATTVLNPMEYIEPKTTDTKDTKSSTGSNSSGVVGETA